MPCFAKVKILMQILLAVHRKKGSMIIKSTVIEKII